MSARTGICLLCFACLIWAATCSGTEDGTRPGSAAFRSVPAPAKSPNVILISIDTLRADHLSSYGYPLPTSPHLDALAAQGILFEAAFTPVPITLPAHTSLLTGTYPAYHGVHDNAGFVAGASLETLAEILASAGYATAAFVGSFILDSQFGLDQGFSHYVDGFQSDTLDLVEQSILEHRAWHVVDQAQQWIRNLRGRQPFFIFVHLFDPHAPYDPPADFPCPFPSAYDCEIAYADRQLGRLFAFLEDNYEPLLLVVTSDHGEGLGEHGEDTHGLFLYDSTLRVPLLIRLPDKAYAGTRLPHSVRLIDVMPTILQVAGVPAPPVVQGRSLAALWKGQERPEEPLLAETLLPSLNYGWAPLYAVRYRSSKYIHAPREELYDLAADPGETENRHSRDQALASSLRQLLQDLRTRYGGESPAVSADSADAGTVAALRSLGYVSYSGRRLTLPSRSGADPKDKIHLFNQIWRSVELTQEGRVHQAVQLLDRVLAEDPEVFVAHSLQALNRLRLQQPDQALRHLETAARLRPEDAGTHLYLGIALFQLGRLKEAREALEESLDLEPANVAAMNNLGTVLVHLGDLQRARTIFEQLLEQRPDDAATWLNLGVVELTLGNPEQAVSRLEKARNLAPQIPEIHNNLGLAYLAVDRRHEARQCFEFALRLRPDYKNARENLLRLQQGSTGR
ncbi:MAG TPA: sulfatase-like hydrolase/transferase [Acidobacteriota bacterium]|nr:sulfatase-like hydrolase/transferase [Acidobacteriota bacterium]